MKDTVFYFSKKRPHRSAHRLRRMPSRDTGNRRDQADDAGPVRQKNKEVIPIMCTAGFKLLRH